MIRPHSRAELHAKADLERPLLERPQHLESKSSFSSATLPQPRHGERTPATHVGGARHAPHRSQPPPPPSAGGDPVFTASHYTELLYNLRAWAARVDRATFFW